MDSSNVFMEVLGKFIYIFPLALILWKGGSLQEQLRTVIAETSKLKEELQAMKDGRVTNEVALESIRGLVMTVSEKLDSIEERLDRLDGRVDKIRESK